MTSIFSKFLSNAFINIQNITELILFYFILLQQLLQKEHISSTYIGINNYILHTCYPTSYSTIRRNSTYSLVLS